MKKRILCFVLVFVMTLGFLPTLSIANAATYGDLTYEIVDEEVMITGCDKSVTSVTIPSEIEGYPVTSIGYWAFYECSSLTQITIPDSVTSIGGWAFRGCSSLTQITIPGSVTSIGDDVFMVCSSLTEITIPDSVTSIGDSAFEACSSLTHITIPDSVTSIGYHAFYDCSSLAEITIPDSVTSIGSLAFWHCTSLKKVYITDVAAWCNIFFDSSDSNPMYNGADLYFNDALITEITIPNGVTSIGDYVFRNCSSLTQITIPDSVTSIGGWAFSGCSSLTQITIPGSVTSIGNGAFYSCSSLTQITIPDSVTSIGDSAFDGCSSLKKFAFSNEMTIVGTEVFEYSGIKVVYIPKEIVLIKNGAFNGTDVNYVYYGGNNEDKQDLTILPNNDALNNATWVYNATGLPECEYDNACDTDCNICGTTRVTTHNFGEYASDNNATTEKDGTKTRVCSVCGAKDTVTDEGTKLVEIKDTTKIFTDVKAKKWYTNAVNYAYSHGFIAGVSDTEFGRDVPVTRGMFITILARIAGVDTSSKANKVTTKFTDVKSGKYYTNAIKWASENGVVNGLTDTEFGPNNAIERQQLCTMIVNFAKYMKIDLKATQTEIKFADATSIRKYAKNAVATCQKAGVVSGYAVDGGTEFKPLNTATRAEAAQILYKFHKDFVA